MPTSPGYIDHRPFAGIGAGLIFGRGPNGSLVRVDEVASGLACNCVCPATDCAQPLITSKGKTVRACLSEADSLDVLDESNLAP